MLQSESTVVVSRILVPLLGLLVWLFYYLEARFAYILPRGWKKSAAQLSLILGAIGIFLLQINVMERWSPKDAYGDHFFSFVMIEAGGALVILFGTLIRERAKSRRAPSGAKVQN